MSSFDDPLNSIFNDLSILQTQAREPSLSQVSKYVFLFVLVEVICSLWEAFWMYELLRLLIV